MNENFKNNSNVKKLKREMIKYNKAVDFEKNNDFTEKELKWFSNYLVILMILGILVLCFFSNVFVILFSFLIPSLILSSSIFINEELYSKKNDNNYGINFDTLFSSFLICLFSILCLFFPLILLTEISDSIDFISEDFIKSEMPILIFYIFYFLSSLYLSFTILLEKKRTLLKNVNNNSIHKMKKLKNELIKSMSLKMNKINKIEFLDYMVCSSEQFNLYEAEKDFKKQRRKELKNQGFNSINEYKIMKMQENLEIDNEQSILIENS